MSDFEVHGAEQFHRLSKALKQAGETEMRKALHKGLRDAVNKVKPEAADALSAALPGRLQGKGKRVRQAVQVKTGADPGISVVVRYGKAGSGLGAINAKLINQRGTFRHPVFGRHGWVAQSVGGQGWFDKTYTNAAPRIREELERVLEQVADDIVRKAR
jgi:hypothetical protein